MSDAPSSAPSAPAGPASANDAQLSGRFAEERNAGYQEMRPSSNGLSTPPKRAEREFSTGREAADELAKKRRKHGHTAPDARPVQYIDDQGRKAPANETVTVARAATDLENSRFTDVVEHEMRDRDAIARRIDQFRADNGAPTDPTAPVDPNQMNPHLFGDLKRQAPQIDPAHLPQNMQPPPPGIDPEVHRAMQHPQVRQAMEEEFGKATQLQQQHAQQVKVANDFAQAAFRSAVPELANLRPDQIVPFLNQMAKTNPQRFKQVNALLDNVRKADTARQQVEAQRAHVERQNFARESAVQDKAFDRAVANYTPEQRRAVTGEMVNYAASLGIDQRTLVHLMQTNPIMRHAAFQKMMFDAAAGSLARKQLAAQRQQNRAANLPPVIRPGSGAPRTTVQSANLQQLSARLTQSGDAKDAAALLIASRNARRRG